MHSLFSRKIPALLEMRCNNRDKNQRETHFEFAYFFIVQLKTRYESNFKTKCFIVEKKSNCCLLMQAYIIIS